MLTRQVPLAFSSKYPSLQKNAVLWNLLYATEHVFVVWYKTTHQGFFFLLMLDIKVQQLNQHLGALSSELHLQSARLMAVNTLDFHLGRLSVPANAHHTGKSRNSFWCLCNMLSYSCTSSYQNVLCI